MRPVVQTREMHSNGVRESSILLILKVDGGIFLEENYEN